MLAQVTTNSKVFLLLEPRFSVPTNRMVDHWQERPRIPQNKALQAVSDSTHHIPHTQRAFKVRCIKRREWNTDRSSGPLVGRRTCDLESRRSEAEQAGLHRQHF